MSCCVSAVRVLTGLATRRSLTTAQRTARNAERSELQTNSQGEGFMTGPCGSGREPEVPTAWEIADEMIHAYDPETGEVDADLWESLQCELGEKAEAIRAVCVRLESESTACGEEIARLTARRRARQNSIERLRSYLLDCLTVAGLERLQTPTLTVSVREGSERVEVSDPNLLDDDLCEVKRTPNKTAIKAAIKAGRDVRAASIVRGPKTVQFK